MPSSSTQLQEQALDLTWSLWAELGVSGWRRHHTSHAIDPEPLILFTASLGDVDPRLRDEATDWCIAYGRYISSSRLKNLLVTESPELQAAFGRFAATVNAHSTLRWSGATQPRRYQPMARSEVSDFRRPSLVSLRLRALFGVGARSEVLRVFVADQSAKLSAADLAVEVGYTKRNVAETLDALRMAGLLEAVPHRNQLRYELLRPKELGSFAAPLPTSFPQWRSIFRILEGLIDLARRGETLSVRVRDVEAVRTAHELEEDLRVLGIRPPRLVGEDEAWSTLGAFGLELAQSWASGRTSSQRSRSRVAL
jgi:DNA-binding transcriptional ArsR family regulator